jgi:hypothetical protein
MHFIYDLQRDILKDYRFGINVILRKKIVSLLMNFSKKNNMSNV